MKHRKAFSTVHRLSKYAHNLEVAQNIGFDTFKLRLCFFQGLFFDPECDILGLDKSVIALCKLIFQHFCVFLTNIVEFVVLTVNFKLAVKLLNIGYLIEKGKLNIDGTVKIVEEVAVILENRCLILVLCKLIVYVEELNCLGIEIIVHLADTVLEHLLERD